MAENFLRYGYNMVCTDGWIEGAQTVNSNGYILKYNSDWKHGFDYWIDYNRKKGLDTGIYYNPLWLTRKAFSDNMKISGSSQRTRDIVGNKSFNDLLYWVDVNKQGAEQWIKGYVRYFINLGFTFLRVDFLRDYEDYYGTDSYVKALKWIKEEAGDEIMISLVMPNCFNHAVNELPYGDLFRISADVFTGGWDFISNRRRGYHNANWPQWENAFDGFVYFSDVAARGQIIMDGDFIRLNKFETEAEKQTEIALQLIAGGPVAAADQYSTIGNNLQYYINDELLALNKDGFVGKPLSNKLGDKKNEIWYGQMQNGDYVLALFNRSDNTATVSVNFAEIGVEGEMNVRDLWAHADEGKASSISANIPAHGCKVVKLTK